MKDIKIKNPKVQHTNYGTFTPVKFTVIDKVRCSSYSRVDTYKSMSTGDEVNEVIFITDREDLSPVYLGKDYSSKCHGCYLGYAHSQNYHIKHK
jgi:hypothetical protein